MKVEVVPFNPDWKTKYITESALIKKACGDKILTIEHAGSTSVEGLAAKPVVDIWVGTKSLKDAHEMIPHMESLGYEYYSGFENELPFRRYFRKDIEGVRAYQVHVTTASHPFRRDDLVFRDYIRINEKARKDYEQMKLELSKKEWNDGLEYNAAKTDFITKMKKEALGYFSKLYEQTESHATYLSYAYTADDANKKTGFKLLRDGELTAIRTDIFDGFSLNRALGITNIDKKILDKMDDFYKGKKGKFALQIPPYLLDPGKIDLLNSRGYVYSNSWVTFYRNSEPIESRGTDLTVKEISKEHAHDFGYMLNEVFSFPHEFDDIAASSVGKKNWVTFMAFDGNTPAGGASICVTGEGAYFNFAHVLPKYRRRGVQGELMKRRIDAAREMGAKWVFVDTAENSEENPNPSYWNMLRHGFRLLYHRPNYVKVQ